MAETLYDRIKEQNLETELNTGNTTVVAEGVVPKNKSQIEEPIIPKEEKSFDVSGLNEYYGTSFENADSLKTIFESQEKHKDFDSQIAGKDTELSQAQEKYNSLLDAIDPEKILPNKEAVALSQLADKYPNADLGVLSNIRSTDLSTMDKLEALVVLDKLTVPSKVSDSIRRDEILRNLDIEKDDVSELTESDRYRIEREYTSKAGTLEEIKGFQPEFNKFDFEAERTTRQQKLDVDKKSLSAHNEKALKIILDGYSETKSDYSEDGKDRAFTYTVGGEFKEKFFGDILTRITDSGVKITNENANEIATDIDNLFWLQNRQDIIQDSIKQALSKEKENNHNEVHSNSPINKTEAPSTTTKVPQTMMEQYRTGKVKTR